MGTTYQGVGTRGRRCPYLGKYLHDGGPGSLSVWVEDVGGDTEHWGVFGSTSLQGHLQAGSTATAEGGLWDMGVSPPGGGNGVGGVGGGVYLCLSHIFHCYQAHYGYVSGVVEAPGFLGIQVVAVA